MGSSLAIKRGLVCLFKIPKPTPVLMVQTLTRFKQIALSKYYLNISKLYIYKLLFKLS